MEIDLEVLLIKEHQAGNKEILTTGKYENRQKRFIDAQRNQQLACFTHINV
jgi:hypothetical protein